MNATRYTESSRAQAVLVSRPRIAEHLELRDGPESPRMLELYRDGQYTFTLDGSVLAAILEQCPEDADIDTFQFGLEVVSAALKTLGRLVVWGYRR